MVDQVIASGAVATIIRVDGGVKVSISQPPYETTVSIDALHDVPINGLVLVEYSSYVSRVLILGDDAMFSIPELSMAINNEMKNLSQRTDAIGGRAENIYDKVTGIEDKMVRLDEGLSTKIVRLAQNAHIQSSTLR